MTLQQLRDKVNIGTCLQGHFAVTITYRGKKYTCISTDTLAYDTIRGYGDGGNDYYTEKQAYQALYDHCKNKNNL
jgi:hypothetical protein